MIRFFRGAVLALMLIPSSGTAQDFGAGMAAHRAGDFATALASSDKTIDTPATAFTNS